MHLRQLIYCFVLVGILGVVAKTASARIVPISKTPRTSRYFDLESRNRETYERARSWRLFIDRPLDWLTLFRWYFGNLVWLLPLVVFMPGLWRSKRTRFALILTAIIAAASLIEVWWRGGGDWRIHRLFSRGGPGHSSPDRGDESST